MEAYAQALNYAIPFFVLLIVVEALAAKRMGMRIDRGADTISSLSSGVTNVVKDVLGLSIAIISYQWLVDQVALIQLEATWLVFSVAFVVKDFAGYWVHRLEHEVNVLWNRHVIHHSSEEFNLACALRQSVSSVLSFIAIFMVPAALVGVPSEVFAVVAPVHLFAQFWYHTRLVGKMGWLEYILVTPSHHRVHHAINEAYLDRNYGQIFIIWDKLFGTFQPEVKEIEPVYGVKRPVRTWNPLLINFQHLWQIIQDTWHAEGVWDKVRIWFMPTGWRPEAVARQYPVGGISDSSRLEKYDTNLNPLMLGYSWIQLGFTLMLMFWFFNQIAAIGMPGIWFYGGFLMLSVFSYTTLMDRNPAALGFEMVRLLAAHWLIWWWGGSWFGLGEELPFGEAVLLGWHWLSVGMVFYWYRQGALYQDWARNISILTP